VSLQVDNNQNIPIPASIQPNFLAKLEFCSSNVIRVSPAGSATSIVSLVPGYQTLKQTSVLLRLLETGLPDLQSFSGLQCPPANIDFRDNLQLTSLSGLEKVSPSQLLESVTIKDNPQLTGFAAFAPLTKLLGCVGTGAGSVSSIPVQVVDVVVAGCPVQIKTLNKLCAYVTGAANCPA
jgi:hypothetical protein